MHVQRFSFVLMYTRNSSCYRSRNRIV